MTDLINMTKAQINALLAAPLSASQLKKKTHADLVAMFDAMPAADALDADLRDARADNPTPDPVLDNSSALTPTDADVLNVLKGLTPAEHHLLVAFSHCKNTVVNAAPKNATGPADLTTWVWLEDRKVGDMTAAQKKGVLSSLVKKGLVHVSPDSDGDMLGWSLLGFEVVQSLLDEELPELSKKAPKPSSRGTEDRILVQPATDPDKISPIRAGTKRHLMAVALARGTTLEHLAEVTGWRRDVVSSALYTDFKAAGLGIERKAGKLHLILPAGVKEIPVRNPAA
jgi:hypothetical protein